MKALTIAAGLLALAGTATAQQADPTRSGQPPWPIDPRCAVIAAHPDQATRAAACAAPSAAAPIQDPNIVPGSASSSSAVVGTQPTRSRTDGRPQTPPPTRE